MSNPVALALSTLVTLLALGLSWLLDAGTHAMAGLPLLPTLALFAFAVQWLVYVPSFIKQTEHYYDLAGSLTYAGVIVLAVLLAAPDLRGGVIAVLVLIWCARLGSFLFKRVKQSGKDGRFDDIKPHWGRFLVAWTFQGLWVFMTLLAALLAITSPAAARWDLLASLGLAVWAAGFAIEVIADRQKSAFRADPANRGRFIHNGLWAWSRHPNYFGEILLWTGIALMATPTFAGWQWLGWLSPLFVAWLLMNVSGVPLLEQRADATWGGQPDYEAYKAKTPVLFPGRRRLKAMIEAILAWASEHRDQALWLVPLLAFMETCVGVGLFVPSLMLVVVCSVFYANDWANLWLMAGMALIGSSLGDHVGYYVGRALGPKVEETRLVQRYISKWRRTEDLVRRYGLWAIFIGRFIPAIRSLVPAMVGITDFPRWRYTPLDLAACSLWALGLVAIVRGAHEVFLP